VRYEYGVEEYGRKHSIPKQQCEAHHVELYAWLATTTTPSSNVIAVLDGCSMLITPDKKRHAGSRIVRLLREVELVTTQQTFTMTVGASLLRESVAIA
jgi:hypothetical protein